MNLLATPPLILLLAPCLLAQEDPTQCGYGQVKGADGVCVDVGPCRPGYLLDAEGMCVNVLARKRRGNMLGKCPPGQVHDAEGTCVDACPPGYLLDSEGMCVDVLARKRREASCPDNFEGDYWKLFTDDNRAILQAWNLENKNLVLDPSMTSGETIKWTQFSKCWWSCYEDYILAHYHDEADVKKELVVHVFVAKAAGPPPKRLSTSGHSAAQGSKLHFGFLFFDSEGSSAIFFVIHPDAWYPFQHRFETNSLTEAFGVATKAIIAYGAKTGIALAIAEAAASGAVIGSFIPGAGTAAGYVLAGAVAAAGAVISLLGNDYIGDYLRFIG